MITTPALAAAFRLSTTLPSSVHPGHFPTRPERRRPDVTREEVLVRRGAVRRLLAQGLSQRAVARRLRVSRTTIQNHVYAIRAGR